MERIIIETKGYTIFETDSCSLEEIVGFVVKENYLHHQKNIPENISEEIRELIIEEQELLPTSRFFLAKDNEGQLIGCIRIHRWNRTSDLPITKFGICIEESVSKNENTNIWHVGRFAIKRHTCSEPLKIFKTLIECAISPIVNCNIGIMLAEIDVKLMSSLRHLGIELKLISNPFYYLGSETCLVFARDTDLMTFYLSHVYLLNMENGNWL